MNPAVECVFNLKSQRLFARNPHRLLHSEYELMRTWVALVLAIKTARFAQFHLFLYGCYVALVLIMTRNAFNKNSVSADVLQNHFAETKNGFGKHVEIYTNGSKTGEAVACAVICGNQIKSMRLPDKSSSSVYTAELSAVRMALELIRRLKEKSFVIYSDSPSSLQAIQSFNIINITVFDILKLYTHLTDI